MNIEQFKNCVVNNTLTSNLVIAEYKDNGDFIFHQYLNKFANDNYLDIEYIDDISQVNSGVNLFGTKPTKVKILSVDKLSEVVIPTNDYVWIKTNKIDKKIKTEYEDYIITIPKLESWQIKDYVMSTCEDFNEKDVDYFLSIYKDNIFRIDNELQKFKGFEVNKIYPLIKDQLYTDVSEYNIFDLVNALIKHDTNALQTILIDLDNIDVDAFGLLKLLITNFKKIIDIQLNPKATAESLNISSKQFWAVKKYSCGHYNREQLISIYTMLNECDFNIKSGIIDTKVIVNYVITKIMTV